MTVRPRLRERLLSTLATDVAVPRYDRSQIRAGIVHFGVGGFHRAHQAVVIDDLLATGTANEWGICGVGLLEQDVIMRDVLTEQDGLYTVTFRAADGTVASRVVGSIIEYLYAPDSPEAVLDKLCDPTVRIVSLTVTEGGYNQDHTSHEFDLTAPGVGHDLKAPGAPETVFGFIVEALRRRRTKGISPFTVVSCDNIQANGVVARASIISFAAAVSTELADWIAEHVSFPNSMVDRITPVTTQQDKTDVQDRYGYVDAWPVVCEPFFQWVLEDRFTAGRPDYGNVGVQLVNDVEPYELMKLRLLNASHQALAYTGSLVGYRYVDEAATDDTIAPFIAAFMEFEAAPTLSPVPGIDIPGYMHTLLERFSNPYIRDTLERIVTDSSNRMQAFVLPILRDQLERDGSIIALSTIIAAWARYAEGFDEAGVPLELNDVNASTLREAASGWSYDAASFIDIQAIFGNLRGDVRFASEFERATRALHADTVVVTLRDATRRIKSAARK